MQTLKRSPQIMRGVLIIVLSSFFLSSIMLIQPLGLSEVWDEQSQETVQQTVEKTSTSTFDVDPYIYDSYDSFDPIYYSRSRQDYDSFVTAVPTTADSFTGDFDPNSDDLPLPDGYNPVDEDEDEPDVLLPIVKPQGLMYTETEFILYVKANSLYMRAGPSMDATVITTLSFGDTVICEGENDEWMKVRHEGQLGFLKTEFTSKEMVFRSVNETVYVSSNTLRLREGPSTDAAIITTLNKNDRLTRTGTGEGWSRVKTASGKTGYVSTDYLTRTAPARSSSSSSSSGSSSRGTVYPGNAGKIVDLAYQALGVRYVWGSHSMSGMDCTGLTYWAYRQIGIAVPRSSSGYYNAGVGVSYSNIRPGDVIAWDAHPRDGRTAITHVGIYVGNGKMIHASSRLGKVVLQDVREYQSWGCKILTIRRFISG